MNISQLRFASLVKEQRSFSRAAEICHVTQPTLSNGIAQLETELGERLFERSTRHVKPTPFGDHMLPLIAQALSSILEVKSSADAYLKPDLKILRIGLSPIVNMERIAQFFAPFVAANGDVKIFYKQCFLADLEARLRSRQIDIALWTNPGPEEFPDFHSVPMYDEPLLFLPNTERASVAVASGSVTVASLATESFVLTPDICGLVRETNRLFRSAGIRLKEYPGQALTYDIMQEWADLGIGAALLPLSKLSPEHIKRARPVTDAQGKSARLHIAASWETALLPPPHVTAFRRHVLDGEPATPPTQMSRSRKKNSA